MTVAITFSWRFLMEDIVAQNSLTALFIPIGDLVLLFGAISFYLGHEEIFPPKVLYLFLGSLFLQVIADTTALYINNPNLESLLVPFSTLSLLLLGLSGAFALGENHENPAKKKEGYSVKDIYSLRLLLPYISVILLFLVMIFQHQESSDLILGSTIAILLVISRQIFTSLENQTVLLKYHTLTEELEQKISERTEELSSKNHQLVTAVRKMKQMAYHDVLSGLPNRRMFLERLVKSMDEAKRNHFKLAVIFIDLDRFKNINDSLGHDFGDMLLKHVSSKMAESLRKIDTISRQGGDEFTIILNRIREEKDVIPLVKRLQSIVAQPIVIKGHELHVSMSIGIALYPRDGKNIEELMKNADMAMYRAKEEGRDTYRFYSYDLNKNISRKVTIENGLRKAIRNGEFLLYYQPQVDCKTGELVGIETLIRWNTVEAGIVLPNEFIPIAEETGLIIPIGEWVLTAACNQAKIWHDSGNNHLKLAVNLSPVQFQHENLVQMIASILKKTGFNPHYLELEITEEISFIDAEEAIKKMKAIRELGVRISIDDFGTGYSSLMYLKRFPINSLKIAKPFIEDMTTNKIDQALVAAIISMAHSLGLSVIAEGIETEQQLLALTELQCDVLQGELISKPLTSTQLNAAKAAVTGTKVF